MNTPTPRTCGELSCDECNARTATLTAERDQLRAENTTLRAAQKACEACDEPTEFEVRQLRADLAEAKERLRSEAMDDYASIKDLQRELATERARLDWVFGNCKVEANDYTTGDRDVYAIHDREDLGAAMKEDAK